MMLSAEVLYNVHRLKCNRLSPCENCVKRNDSEACSYASTGGRPRRTQISGSFSSSDEMQSRIDRLEGLVLSLMHSKDHSISGSDSSVVGRHSSVAHGGKIPNVMAEDDEDDDDDDEFDYGEDAMVTETTIVRKVNRAKQEHDAQVEEVRHALGVMQVGKGVSYFRGETHINTILQEVCPTEIMIILYLGLCMNRSQKLKPVIKKRRRRNSSIQLTTTKLSHSQPGSG